jgi:ring-1,2-phenylacetyl-CoA epoxidase subunit PaaB
MSNVYWPLYEVFVRSKQGLSHRHVGSLHAADDRMALENARDAYTRRSEGCSIWVVKASEIVASQPEESGEFFDPAESKVYRHPTFYTILMASSICEARMKTVTAYALRLGDNGLVLSQRLGAWCGHAPELEIDLALANIGLDLLGQARNFLTYAAELKARAMKIRWPLAATSASSATSCWWSSRTATSPTPLPAST